MNQLINFYLGQQLQPMYAQAEAFLRPLVEEQRRTLGDGNPATISSGIAISGTVTANAIGGNYNVSANTIGAASAVNFSLTNDIIAPTASLSASNV